MRDSGPVPWARRAELRPEHHSPRREHTTAAEQEDGWRLATEAADGRGGFEVRGYSGVEAEFINGRYYECGTDERGLVRFRSVCSDEVWAYGDGEERWRVGHFLDMELTSPALGGDYGYIRSGVRRSGDMPWDMREWKENRGSQVLGSYRQSQATN